MSKRRRGQDDEEGGGEDPEFLGLTERQRARIDAAFDRGLEKASGRKRKRPRSDVNGAGPSRAFKPSDIADEGGFLDEADGGFVDEGEGGFMDEEEGGFLPDEPPEPIVSRPSSALSTPPPSDAKVPLSLIPRLLQSLGLPYDDDVLNVFKASASGWDSDDPRSSKRGGSDGGGGVERKDFRAVCAALMAGDGDENGEGDVAMDDLSAIDPAEGDNRALEEEDGGGGFLGGEDVSDNDESDAYLDSQSSLSSLSSDSEFGASRPRRAGARNAKGKGKARGVDTESEAGSTRKTRRKTKKDVLRETGPIKLSGKQREVVQDIWDMLRPPTTAPSGKRAPNILGRDEVKKWARSLGEMWTEDEITEMVTLFSMQHEQRGLSFEDFGAIMVRAGLA